MTNEGRGTNCSIVPNDKYRFEGSNSQIVFEDGSCKDGNQVGLYTRKSGITEIKTIGGRIAAICSIEQFQKSTQDNQRPCMNNQKSRIKKPLKHKIISQNPTQCK